MGTTKKIDVKGTIVSNDDKWIYDWMGYDAVCPKDIEKGLQEAGGDDVVFVINSGGGDVFAGNDMAYAISQYSGNSVADISGFCGSAASIVSCSAKKARAYPSTMYMIHNVSSGASGDYHEMDKQSQILQKANSAISILYQQKTGRAENELLSLMDRESWFNAREAKEFGFVDEIIGENGGIPFTVNNSFGNIIPDEAKQKIRNLAGCRNPTPEDADTAGMLLAKEQIRLMRMRGENRL